MGGTGDSGYGSILTEGDGEGDAGGLAGEGSALITGLVLGDGDGRGDGWVDGETETKLGNTPNEGEREGTRLMEREGEREGERLGVRLGKRLGDNEEITDADGDALTEREGKREAETPSTVNEEKPALNEGDTGLVNPPTLTRSKLVKPFSEEDQDSSSTPSNWLTLARSRTFKLSDSAIGCRQTTSFMRLMFGSSVPVVGE